MSDGPALQPKFAWRLAANRETRSPERLAAHYAVEARLARILAAASAVERPALYGSLYRELFASVPDHPQHRGNRSARHAQIDQQAAILLRGLDASSTYVEIGCGDALLTKAIATRVASAIGVDVTEVLVEADAPTAFRFVKSDGVTLALADRSADLVYSNQLMEHLHVDDALAQLREILRILKPGGRYICCTPNRLSGPHDISVYFTDTPTGFHMREYDHRSLAGIFRAVGFGRVEARVMLKGRPLDIPVALAGALEWLIERLPAGVKSPLVVNGPLCNLLGLTLVGIK